MFQPHLLLYVPTTPPPLCSNHTSSSMFQPHLLLYVPTTPPPLCSNHTSSSMFQPHLLLYVPTTPSPLCSNHTSSMFQSHLLLYVPPPCSHLPNVLSFLLFPLIYMLFFINLPPQSLPSLLTSSPYLSSSSPSNQPKLTPLSPIFSKGWPTTHLLTLDVSQRASDQVLHVC